MSPFELLVILLPGGLLLATWLAGRAIERAHLRQLALREAQARALLVTNLRRPPPGYEAAAAQLCCGSVVIGSDYFKRFGAALKTLVGGRLRTLETLLERGRREAVLRMLDEARSGGADLVCNVRIETANIGTARGDNTALAAAEVIAYGTALRRRGATDAPYRG